MKFAVIILLLLSSPIQMLYSGELNKQNLTSKFKEAELILKKSDSTKMSSYVESLQKEIREARLNNKLKEKELSRLRYVLAKMQHKLGQHNIALLELKSLYQTSSTKGEQEEMGLALTEVYFSENDFVTPSIYIDEIAVDEKHVLNPWAQYLKARQEISDGQTDQALVRLNSLLRNYIESDLANKIMYTMSSVYEKKNRPIDQLQLLQSLGHVGQKTKRYHEPGKNLYLYVLDKDLSLGGGAPRIQVQVKTKLSKDLERVWLQQHSSHRGWYSYSMPTAYGESKQNDTILQCLGADEISIRYTNDPDTVQSTLSIYGDAELLIGSGNLLDEETELEDLVLKSINKLLPVEEKEKSEDESHEKKRNFNQIRPGNSAYVYLKDIDRDRSASRDKVEVLVETKNGFKKKVTLVETAEHSSLFSGSLKTSTDKSSKDIFLLAGDSIKIKYVDPLPVMADKKTVVAELKAVYHDASIAFGGYDVSRKDDGTILRTPKVFHQVGLNDSLFLEIVDYDLDETHQHDFARAKVKADGFVFDLKLKETRVHSGKFRHKIQLTTESSQWPESLKVKPGMKISLEYTDKQNNIQREPLLLVEELSVVAPKAAELSILQSELMENKPVYKEVESDIVLVNPDVPLTYQLIDSEWSIDSKSEVMVSCEDEIGRRYELYSKPSDFLYEHPTEEKIDKKDLMYKMGRFIGQIQLKLGDGLDTPKVSKFMFQHKAEHGRVEVEDDLEKNDAVAVLNVSGNRVYKLVYTDAKDASDTVTKSFRVGTQAQIGFYDSSFFIPVEEQHPSYALNLQVRDADADMSSKRDRVHVEVVNSKNKMEKLNLIETEIHSGVFRATVPLSLYSSNEATQVSTTFNTVLKATYLDSLSPKGENKVTTSIKMTEGEDASLWTQSVIIEDDEMKFDTFVQMAESYYQLYQRYLELEETAQANLQLQQGVILLNTLENEVFEEDTQTITVTILKSKLLSALGNKENALNLLQELKQKYPFYSESAKIQFEIAKLYQEMEKDQLAMHAYIELVAHWPQSDQVPVAMKHVFETFYDEENYKQAAKIGEKLSERFPGSEMAIEVAFKVGQAYYKNESHEKAALHFEAFAKNNTEHELYAQALFWSGECYRLHKNNQKAFRLFNQLRWEKPNSEAAKYAKTRLALPEMLRQFEKEAELNEK